MVDSNKDASSNSLFSGIMVGGGIGMAKVGAKFGGLPFAASYFPTDKLIEGQMNKQKASIMRDFDGMSDAMKEDMFNVAKEGGKDMMNGLKLGLRNSVKSFYKSPKGVSLKYGSAFLTGGVYGAGIEALAHHTDANGDHPMWASAAAGGLVGAKVGTLAYGVFGDAMMNEAKNALADGLGHEKTTGYFDKRREQFSAKEGVSDFAKEAYDAQNKEMQGFATLGSEKLKETTIKDFGDMYGHMTDHMKKTMPGMGNSLEKVGKGYGFAYRRFNTIGAAAASTGLLSAAGAGIGMIHHAMKHGGGKKGESE